MTDTSDDRISIQIVDLASQERSEVFATDYYTMVRMHITSIRIFLIALIGFFVTAGSSACSAVKTAGVPVSTATRNSTSLPSPEFSTPPDRSAITPEPAGVSYLGQNCLEKQDWTQNVSIQGSLLYHDSSLDKTLAVDVSSLNLKEVEGAGWTFLEVSPSGDTFADDELEGKVTIFSLDQKLDFSEPDNLHFDSFLMDGHLRLKESKSTILKKSYQESIGFTDEYFLLSPDMGGIASYSVFLPFYDELPFANSYLEYSPDMKYVLYSAYEKGEYKTFLMDIENNNIVWKGAGIGDSAILGGATPRPVWKPDGDIVTVGLYVDEGRQGQNFYNIFVNGQVVQLTHLENLTNDPYRLERAVWSPDGRYLAFTMLAFSEPWKIAFLILDTKTGALIDPCLSLTIGKRLRFFWSPESYLVAVMQKGETNTVIIDLSAAVVYELPEKSGFKDGELLGWVNWEIPYQP